MMMQLQIVIVSDLGLPRTARLVKLLFRENGTLHHREVLNAQGEWETLSDAQPYPPNMELSYDALPDFAYDPNRQIFWKNFPSCSPDMRQGGQG